MKKFYKDLRLGILGGGQLGRMLIQASINYNIDTWVLDPDEEAPCKNICNHFIVGSLSDYETVYNFGKQVDFITIEIEKVNTEALERLEAQGVVVYPQSRILRIIQDKGLQKQFFKENDIPSAPFQLISSKEDLNSSDFAFPYIQKLRRDGYDGKGVYKICSEMDFEGAFEKPSLIEQYVDFQKELAIIIARNPQEEIQIFPCVEMEFNAQANLVEFLISPADIDAAILQRAEQLAVKIVKSLQFVGILAVELFLTREGELLVNELAPRPHNSGHHTIEGNYVSQYEQHLRAIFDLPLGRTSCRGGYAVMVNLLGEEGYEGLADYEEGLHDVLGLSGVYVHLYGKKYTKPFRKMGHVTILDDDRGSAIKKAHYVQKVLKVKA